MSKGIMAGAGVLIPSGLTAAPTDVLSGFTFIGANKDREEGTITSKAGETIVPGTSARIISQGLYIAGNQVIKGDANLLAQNIRKGVTIFGVTGTWLPDQNNLVLAPSSFAGYWGDSTRNVSIQNGVIRVYMDTYISDDETYYMRGCHVSLVLASPIDLNVYKKLTVTVTNQMYGGREAETLDIYNQIFAHTTPIGEMSNPIATSITTGNNGSTCTYTLNGSGDRYLYLRLHPVCVVAGGPEYFDITSIVFSKY